MRTVTLFFLALIFLLPGILFAQDNFKCFRETVCLKSIDKECIGFNTLNFQNYPTHEPWSNTSAKGYYISESNYTCLDTTTGTTKTFKDVSEQVVEIHGLNWGGAENACKAQLDNVVQRYAACK